MKTSYTEQRGWTLVVALVIVCLLPAGCGDDDPTPAAPGLPPVIDSSTSLMQHFVTAYEQRDADLYAWLLHPAFKSVIHPGTLAAWADADAPLTGPTFSRDEEIAIHGNLCGGAAGVGPAGEAVPPVRAIQFEMVEQYSSWTAIDPGNEFFGGHGGMFAPFAVRILFDHAGDQRSEVHEDIGVYVAPVERDGQTSWLLLGLWGSVFKAPAVEGYTLCSIKARYRGS
jgi:hypothetical protein